MNDNNNIVGRASQQYDHLEFTLVPPEGNQVKGSVQVYEDDGDTYAYFQKNGYAWTSASYTIDGTKTTFTIETSTSRHDEMPSSRRYSLRLLNILPPQSVKITSPSSSTVSFDRWGGDKTWSYDGDEIAVVIDLGMVDTTKPVVVEIQSSTSTKLDGLRGTIEKALWAKRNLDETRSAPGAHTPDPKGAPLVRLASMSDALAVNNPDTFSDLIDESAQLLSDAIAELVSAVSNDNNDDARMAYSVELLRSATV